MLKLSLLSQCFLISVFIKLIHCQGNEFGEIFYPCVVVVCAGMQSIRQMFGSMNFIEV